MGLRTSPRRLRLGAVAGAMLVTALLAAPAAAQAAGFRQANLVSDKPGLAMLTDSNLVNPWGLGRGADDAALDRRQRHRRVDDLSGRRARDADLDRAARRLDPGRRADGHGVQPVDRRSRCTSEARTCRRRSSSTPRRA